jgi:hypothetical protein
MALFLKRYELPFENLLSLAIVMGSRSLDRGEIGENRLPIGE